jgi:hypothetical protein
MKLRLNGKTIPEVIAQVQKHVGNDFKVTAVVKRGVVFDKIIGVRLWYNGFRRTIKFDVDENGMFIDLFKVNAYVWDLRNYGSRSRRRRPRADQDRRQGIEERSGDAGISSQQTGV